MYGVCDKTFKKWLKPFDNAIGDKNGRYNSVVRGTVIFDKPDVPCRSQEL